MVTNGDPNSKERAASALWHLSVDTDNKQQITRAGGIAPLVTLLENGTAQSHEFAAGALSRLAASNADNQAQIAKKLVTLLAPSMSDGAQRRAAQELWALARGQEGATARVVNAGAISPLVNLLGSASSMETKAAAEGGLAYLAQHDTSNQCGQAIASGLVQMLGSVSAEVRVQVMETVIKFVQQPQTVTAIAESGMIERLILHMQAQMREGIELTAAVLRSLELEAQVMLHLCCVAVENARRIANSGGIKPLVALACVESAEAQAQAAAVLGRVASVSAEQQLQLVRDGAVVPLLNMLDVGDSLEAKAEAAGAVWALASGNSQAQDAILSDTSIETKAVALLVRLLDAPSPNAQQKAAGALTSLAAGSAASQESIVEAGAIQPLVALLGTSHDDNVHAQAATALAELAREHGAIQSAVAAASAIEPCVRVLRNANGAEAAREATARALCSLASKHRANQDAVAQLNGLAPLVSLVAVGGPLALEQASGALAALARDHIANQEAISRMLVALLDPPPPEHRSARDGSADPPATRCDVPHHQTPSGRLAAANAASAMSRLAQEHPSNQVLIAQVGGIVPLVRLLVACSDATDNADRQLQREMAAALRSMALGSEPNQVAVAEAGAVPSLVRLVCGGATEVHAAAAGALWSLGALPANQELIAREGGIAPLVRLLSAGQLDVQEAAAGALHNLAARSDNCLEINEAGGVHALVSLFERGTEESKVQAAGALSLMSVGHMDIQTTVAKSLVLTLSESESSAAKEHVTHLVRKLSPDPGNRSALSRADAVPHLVCQLRDGSSAGSASATAALVQLAFESADHRIQVTQQLVALLGSDVEETRERASTALKEMAAAEAGDGLQRAKMTVATAGGIDLFVSLLRDGSLEAKEYALWLLWQSVDIASKRAVANARCTEHIMTAFLSGLLSTVAQEHAITIIARLVSDLPGVTAETRKANAHEVVRKRRHLGDGATTDEADEAFGGLPIIVGLLEHDHAAARKQAALALALLALPPEGPVADCQLQVAGAGAVPILTSWLDRPKDGYATIAARALSSVARSNTDTQTTIAEAGAISQLVAMTGGNGDEDSQHWAAFALAALAEGHTANRVAIAEVGGIVQLVELLNDVTRQKPHLMAAMGLWKLATDDDDNQIAATRAGGLQPLVRMLGYESAPHQQMAAATLEVLSGSFAEMQVAVMKSGAVPGLVGLLGSDDQDTQGHAQRALLNIATPNAANVSAVIKPLIALLEVRNPFAQVKAVESLSALASRSPTNRAAIAGAGAIPPLVGVLGDGRNPNRSQMLTARVLSVLAASGDSTKQAIVKANGVLPLCKMLASAEPEAQGRAVSALFSLATTASAQGKISDAGGIDLLVTQLGSDRAEARRHAVGTLYSMACNTSSKGAIAKAAGAIPYLTTLLVEHTSPETQEWAAGVLAQLAKEKGPSRKAIVAQAGAVQRLIELLAPGNAAVGTAVAVDAGTGAVPSATTGGSAGGRTGDSNGPAAAPEVAAPSLPPAAADAMVRSANTQKYAACALWGVTCDEAFREVVVEAGAVKPLVQVLRSSSEAKGYATATLCNLSKIASVCQAITEAGAVDPLLAMQTSQSQWLRQQAVGILGQLSSASKGSSKKALERAVASAASAKPRVPQLPGRVPLPKPPLRTDKIPPPSARGNKMNISSRAAAVALSASQPSSARGSRISNSSRTAVPISVSQRSDGAHGSAVRRPSSASRDTVGGVGRRGSAQPTSTK